MKFISENREILKFFLSFFFCVKMQDNKKPKIVVKNTMEQKIAIASVFQNLNTLQHQYFYSLLRSDVRTFHQNKDFKVHSKTFFLAHLILSLRLYNTQLIAHFYKFFTNEIRFQLHLYVSLVIKPTCTNKCGHS